MRYMQYMILLPYLSFFGLLCIPTTFADETYTLAESSQSASVVFTNDNWYSVLHPLISVFTARSNGNAYGTTTTGVPFRQYTVPNNAGVRVQRFEIQDHFHYIVDGRVVNTLETLSAQLALAYKAFHSAAQ